MVPGAGQVTPGVELFGTRTRPAFDELGAARTLAQMIVDMVLQRERAARLVQFASRPGAQMTLAAVIDTMVAATWGRPTDPSPKLAAIQRVTQRAVAERLIQLAADSAGSPEVRGIVDLKLLTLRSAARGRSANGTLESRAHWASIAKDIDRWIEKGEVPPMSPALVAPPGDPFGIPE